MVERGEACSCCEVRQANLHRPCILYPRRDILFFLEHRLKITGNGSLHIKVTAAELTIHYQQTHTKSQSKWVSLDQIVTKRSRQLSSSVK
jgi:hypothetical protein